MFRVAFQHRRGVQQPALQLLAGAGEQLPNECGMTGRLHVIVSRNHVHAVEVWEPPAR